ncbi:MAG: hypothetical protein TR69_WS6001000549 [candidate division WS6 bacterium OLB20]|uniref:Alpha/beta hydrolase family protein n=1 Tax=candidate division WS6 bacterium OLB20 TaxID=1617426 RepID=A0A136LY03_9BACT|nr:MAG: hypothetical protein TR69_WS6001000549 [candidate division WS6 bacterium OLB20]
MVSLDDHIYDTNKVLEYFSNQFEHLYLTGHSLGAVVVCFADQSMVERVVLWDPSTGFDDPASKQMTFISGLDAYLCSYRMDTLFGRQLIEQWMNTRIENQIEA